MMVRRMISVGRSAWWTAAFIAPGDSLQVVAVVHLVHMPSVGGKPTTDVLAEAQVGGAVDGDAVVIIDQRELAELQMAGQGCGLAGHALHQVAIAHERPGAVVHDGVVGGVAPRGQEPLGQRHADRVAHALPERPGGGLDARGCGLAPGGPASPSPTAGSSGYRRGRGRSRSGAAASRAASRRGRRRARTGRGPASRGCAGRASGTGSRGRRRPVPAPSGCRGGRSWPAAPHPWPGP